MRTTLTALLLVLAPFGSALAQQEVPQAIEPDTFFAYEDYDLNRDGQVTVAEFLSRVSDSEKDIARGCDVDRDGLISRGEHEICSVRIATPGGGRR